MLVGDAVTTPKKVEQVSVVSLLVLQLSQAPFDLVTVRSLAGDPDLGGAQFRIQFCSIPGERGQEQKDVIRRYPVAAKPRDKTYSVTGGAVQVRPLELVALNSDNDSVCAIWCNVAKRLRF